MSNRLVCGLAAGVIAGTALVAVPGTSAVAQVGARPDHPTAPPSTPTPSSSPTPSPSGAGSCVLSNPDPEFEENDRRLVCVEVVSHGQSFTGPLTLGPATYTLQNVDLDGCTLSPPQPFPSTVTTGQNYPQAVYAACEENNFWTGHYWGSLSVTANYAAGSPLPVGDVASMTATDQRDQNNSATCANAQHTQCIVDYVQPSGRAPHLNFSLRNFPITVIVKNNLPTGDAKAPNTLVPVGSPGYGTALIPDPAGSQGTDVAAGGGTVNFGMYGQVPTAAMQYQPKPSGTTEGFSASYQVVAGTSSLYSGIDVSVNSAIDLGTGRLADPGAPSASPSASPSPSPSPTGSNDQCQVSNDPNNLVDCSLTLIGTPGAPQTIFVNVYPTSND